MRCKASWWVMVNARVVGNEVRDDGDNKCKATREQAEYNNNYNNNNNINNNNNNYRPSHRLQIYSALHPRHLIITEPSKSPPPHRQHVIPPHKVHRTWSHLPAT